MTTIKNDQVEAVECRFAVYCPPPEGSHDDLHLVKEVIHTKDGQLIPNVRLLKNYKRNFFITNKNARNHQQKKETELKSKVMEYKCTQTELIPTITRAIEMPYFKGRLRQLCRNPYIYGADIKSTAVIKRQYGDRFPDKNTPYSAAMSDTETDVIKGHGEVIMDTISMKGRVYTAIQKKFVEGHSMVIPRLQEMLKQYLGEYVESRGIVWEVELVDSQCQVVVNVLKKAHEWKPDFFSMWNIDFDIPKMISAIESGGLDPKDIFSDPSVPPEFRHFQYVQGPKQKITASGKVIPRKPPEQWHTVLCPSSFYVIDSMCAFKHIRITDPSESSYSLDHILGKFLGLGKLRFTQADHVGHGLAWHILMQTEYPLEYVIYNVFDCISMELLDEKTYDLSIVLPMLSGCSDFSDFKSQPRRLVDELHFFVQKQDPARVFGTTSDQMESEFDSLTVDPGGNWITMLPAHLLADNGLCLIEESPELRTNIRVHVADLDVAASYPNSGVVMNIARNTTVKELISIEGVDDYTRRMQGINISSGATNAVEICCNLFKMPSLGDLLEAFAQEEVNKLLT